MPHSSIPEWATHLMTLLGGGIGIKLLDWLRERRKQRLDADTALQETIDRRVKLILEDDEKTITRLTDQVEELTKQAAAMRKYIGELVFSLRAANITVPARPDELKDV